MNQHWLMVNLKEPEMEQKIGNFTGSENKQNVAEMRILRWMTDVSRRDKNECIRESVKVGQLSKKFTGNWLKKRNEKDQN